MTEVQSNRFSRLPTPAKILLIISLALLPIGLASAWSAKRGFDAANAISTGRARDQAMVASEAMNALIARNMLAVRLAANAALAGDAPTACDEAQRILAASLRFPMSTGCPPAPSETWRAVAPCASRRAISRCGSLHRAMRSTSARV